MADESYQLSLANELLDRGLKQAALDLATQSLALAPECGAAWQIKARASDALEDFARAARAAPATASILNDYGLALQNQGRGAEASLPLAAAAALAPEIAGIWSNLAAARMGAGYPAQGADFAQRALGLARDDPAARYNLGMCQLMLGDAAGFAGHEWRFAAGAVPPSPIAGTRWAGEMKPDAVLYVHAEQGLGDSLLFARFLPLARQRVGRVVLGVQPQLLRALSKMADEVVSVLAAPPDFDVQISLMSLPFVLGSAFSNLPPPPNIAFDAALAREFGRRLGALRGLKAGLVWQGNPLFPGDRSRSMPVRLLEPLAAARGISWISLQTGADRARAGMGPPMIDWMDEMRDVADTAALISQLDLVIGVDSMLCHLSGALRRPIWILNRFNSCWRWFVGREDSPWYPTLRLFRQAEPGRWDDVVLRVLQELQCVNEDLTLMSQ